MLYELEGFPGVPEPGLYLRFDGIEPCQHFGRRGCPQCEYTGCPDFVACLISPFFIAGKCRYECHVREHGRAKKSVLGGLAGNDEAGLRFCGVLQVEEFDAAGQQA